MPAKLTLTLVALLLICCAAIVAVWDRGTNYKKEAMAAAQREQELSANFARLEAWMRKVDEATSQWARDREILRAEQEGARNAVESEKQANEEFKDWADMPVPVDDLARLLQRAATAATDNADVNSRKSAD